MDKTKFKINTILDDFDVKKEYTKCTEYSFEYEGDKYYLTALSNSEYETIKVFIRSDPYGFYNLVFEDKNVSIYNALKQLLEDKKSIIEYYKKACVVFDKVLLLSLDIKNQIKEFEMGDKYGKDTN